MSLTLTVLTFKNKPITEPVVVSIDNNGGTIGRSDDNTLVLPDAEKIVSRHHATIKAENGYYYLTDTSLGGVYINGQEPPLHNATRKIENGYLLKIGEYEVAVTLVNEPINDDFPFPAETEKLTQKLEPLEQTEELWLGSDEIGFNSLMTDNFPKHEELIQRNGNEYHAEFESGLQHNNSPLFDSYTAPEIISHNENIPEFSDFNDLFSETAPTKNHIVPEIIPHAPTNEIPEDFSFDDLFSETDLHTHAQTSTVQATNKPEDDNFEAFLGSAISEIACKTDDGVPKNNESPSIETSIEPIDIFSNTESVFENSAPVLPKTIQAIKPEKQTIANLVVPDLAENKPVVKKSLPTSVEYDIFNKFLQGAAIKCNKIQPEQQAETMQRIGQMFRKLVDGTVAVLRSRAEFKSLCRVNMTVIRATNNNPLKFTVSTDDVLQQLVENKSGGFLGSVDAIEESFNDIMNHQLAMQAGIQASLTDLLKTFDPKIIEKQFEQGIVLQKKAKCWEKYEETYQNTVEDAVENFFGEEFVKAYEKQMNVLTNSRKKNN